MTQEHMSPAEIERRSFAIIAAELGPTGLGAEEEAVLRRVIHTTADFSYRDNLVFAPDAVEEGVAALRRGETLVTDTNMALAGVNKAALARLGAEAVCYMADGAVAEAAARNGTTRAFAAMDKACALPGRPVMAVGNAPTALLRLCALLEEGRIAPSLIIGVPVGFVNVVESKELLVRTGVPYIAAMGRKGGSTVAAAICNALAYLATGRTL